MKKEDVTSTIVYLIMLLVVFLVGFFVIQSNSQAIANSLGGSEGIIYAFVILTLIGGILFNIIFTEVGHMIGAKMGNYHIVSVNVLGFCFYKTLDKETNKIKFKFGFKTFDGLAGETKIAPNENNKKSSPFPYLLMPFVIVLLEFLALVFVYIYIDDKSNLVWLKYLVVMFATLGGIFIIYNYIPIKLDSETDGYRYTLLIKSINVQAFNTLLKLKEDMMLNKEDLVYPYFDEITDYTASINLLKIYDDLDKNDLDDALKIVDTIINSEAKLNQDTRSHAKYWKIYLLTLLEKNEEAKTLYESLSEYELKYLKKGNTLLSSRSLLSYVGLVENSYELVDDISISYLKTFKSETDAFKEKDKKLFDSLVVKIELLKTK